MKTNRGKRHNGRRIFVYNRQNIVHNPDMKNIIDLYLSGMSLTQVSEICGVPISTVRRKIIISGNLRTRQDGICLAASQGRLGSGRRGKKIPHTQDTKNKMRAARNAWSKKNSKGYSKKPNGYIEYTTGPNKGRSVHVVMMEAKIGRRIYSDECVHHIDDDRANNCLENLALMTKAAHARLHRLQDQANGKLRERDKYGRFC